MMQRAGSMPDDVYVRIRLAHEQGLLRGDLNRVQMLALLHLLFPRPADADRPVPDDEVGETEVSLTAEEWFEEFEKAMRLSEGRDGWR